MSILVQKSEVSFDVGKGIRPPEMTHHHHHRGHKQRWFRFEVDKSDLNENNNNELLDLNCHKIN